MSMGERIVIIIILILLIFIQNTELHFQKIERFHGIEERITTPTLSALEEFVREDKTDEREYTNDNTCINFANTFINNFRRKGYFSCTAIIVFGNVSHVIVAVNTTDRGVVYVEPQTDFLIFELKEGDDYCEVVGWNCNWKIKKIESCFTST